MMMMRMMMVMMMMMMMMMTMTMTDDDDDDGVSGAWAWGEVEPPACLPKDASSKNSSKINFRQLLRDSQQDESQSQPETPKARKIWTLR
eukprot:11876700-Karenia_brevis.AAC.1